MHKLITLGFLWAVVAMAAADSFAAPPRQSKTYPLRARRTPGAIERVEVSLQVTGENKVAGEKKVERFKMSVSASATYDERLLEFPAGADKLVRSVRHYDNADVLLKLEGEELRPALGDDRRLVGVAINPPSVTFFSPGGPPTRGRL